MYMSILNLRHIGLFRLLKPTLCLRLPQWLTVGLLRQVVPPVDILHADDGDGKATNPSCFGCSVCGVEDRTEAAAIECGWDGCMCGSCAQDVSAPPFVVAKVETARLAQLHDVMASSTPQAAEPRL
jgi:hypothetical protein